jgi:hypothetical protein
MNPQWMSIHCKLSCGICTPFGPGGMPSAGSRSYSFESGTDGWTVGGPSGNGRWTRGTSTPSSSTGATRAASGRWFYFLETSAGSSGDISYLLSPRLSSITSMSFYYHMHGATMSTLSVQVVQVGSSRPAGGQRTVWSKTGQQQRTQSEAWLSSGTIRLPSGTTQVRFMGMKGTSYTGDMSVDDIVIRQPQNASLNASDVDECASNPCLNGSTCLSSKTNASIPAGSYSCCATSAGSYSCATSTPAPVRQDCVGSWGVWTPCSSQLCGQGTQSKTFTVTTAVQHGGSACSASHGQVQLRRCGTQGMHTISTGSSHMGSVRLVSVPCNCRPCATTDSPSCFSGWQNGPYWTTANDIQDRDTCVQHRCEWRGTQQNGCVFVPTPTPTPILTATTPIRLDDVDQAKVAPVLTEGLADLLATRNASQVLHAVHDLSARNLSGILNESSTNSTQFSFNGSVYNCSDHGAWLPYAPNAGESVRCNEVALVSDKANTYIPLGTMLFSVRWTPAANATAQPKINITKVLDLAILKNWHAFERGVFNTKYGPLIDTGPPGTQNRWFNFGCDGTSYLRQGRNLSVALRVPALMPFSEQIAAILRQVVLQDAHDELQCLTDLQLQKYFFPWSPLLWLNVFTGFGPGRKHPADMPSESHMVTHAQRFAMDLVRGTHGHIGGYLQLGNLPASCKLDTFEANGCALNMNMSWLLNISSEVSADVGIEKCQKWPIGLPSIYVSCVDGPDSTGDEMCRYLHQGQWCHDSSPCANVEMECKPFTQWGIGAVNASFVAANPYSEKADPLSYWMGEDWIPDPSAGVNVFRRYSDTGIKVNKVRAGELELEIVNFLRSMTGDPPWSSLPTGLGTCVPKNLPSNSAVQDLARQQIEIIPTLVSASDYRPTLLVSDVSV